MSNSKEPKPKKSKPVLPPQPVPESAQNLMHLWDPHIESFNYFLGEGMKRAVESLDPLIMDLDVGRLKCIYLAKYRHFINILMNMR